jgi:transcriptional regulator with XRE-family HTH domain
MNIGKGIKAILKKSNMSQRDLAEKIGISETSISLLIQNKTQPRKETVELISNALGIESKILLLLSIDLDDIPKGKEELYKNIWPFVENAVIDIFSKK